MQSQLPKENQSLLRADPVTPTAVLPHESQKLHRQWWRYALAVPALVLTLVVAVGALWAASPELATPPKRLQLLFQEPADGDEPHIKKPDADSMMTGGDDSCDHSDPDCAGGDLLLDPDQRKALAQGSIGIKAKGASVFQNWPGGVVKYAWDPSIDARAKRLLEEAMPQWRAKTCIKFSETAAGKGVVTFMSSKKGCHAHLGYGSSYARRLNLEMPGCNKIGIAIHELGHVIGLLHEHARPDAVDYIKFQHQNMNQFGKSTLKTDSRVPTAHVPYDMASVMHYGAWAGAKSTSRTEQTKTMTVKKKDVFGNCKMGQRLYLSEGDIVTVNRLYRCPNHYCADLHGHCKVWQGRGFCGNKYKAWMEQNCPHSCGICECKDTDRYANKCPKWASWDICVRGKKGTAQHKRFMKDHCRKSCGMCLVEDALACKDLKVWNDVNGCSKAKRKRSTIRGVPVCQNHWFAGHCPVTCDLCPHRPFCY